MSKTAICPHLTDYINTSISYCAFHEELKAATVSPVFKSKESYLKYNYRPISVLTSASKMFERIICDQMQSYFSALLSNLLSGKTEGIVYFALLTLLFQLREWTTVGTCTEKQRQCPGTLSIYSRNSWKYRRILCAKTKGHHSFNCSFLFCKTSRQLCLLLLNSIVSLH